MPIRNAGDDAKNSMLMSRAPLPPLEATRGNTAYLPFWPAGFPNPATRNISNVTSDGFQCPTSDLKDNINFKEEGNLVFNNNSCILTNSCRNVNSTTRI